MKREDLHELKRLLALLRAEHPEFEVILTEDKTLAEQMYADTHTTGPFSIPLELQVEICINDPLNTNL